MINKIDTSLIKTFVLAGLVFFIFSYLYSPRPDFWLIVEFLEAKSIATFGGLLDQQPLNIISNSVGVPRLVLPSLLLAPLTFLKRAYPLFLPAVNYSLIITSGMLLLNKVNFDDPKPLSVITLLFFILSPVVFQAVTSSVNAPLLLLLFSIYVYSKKGWVKSLVVIAGLLVSFAAWPLFFLLVIIEMPKSKNIKSTLLRLAGYITLVVILVNGINFKELISTYYPILIPKTHGFYVDIHRQADLVANVPLLGKVFYNKYVVIPRMIFEQFIKYFDWDLLVFHSASGKFTSNPPTFALITLFELPIFIYSLYLGLRKKITGVKFLLITATSMALYQFEEDLILIYFFIIIYLSLQAWQVIDKRIHKSLLLVLISLVFLGRIILINHSQSELSSLGNTYNQYEELANYLNSNKLSTPIILTDRLGQPHIYLTYFNVNSIEDLRENLANTERRDSKGLLQPDLVNDVIFSSFKYSIGNELVSEYPSASYIELEKNFININEIAQSNTTHKFREIIRVDKNGKSNTTNLFLLTNQ